MWKAWRAGVQFWAPPEGAGRQRRGTPAGGRPSRSDTGGQAPPRYIGQPTTIDKARLEGSLDHLLGRDAPVFRLQLSESPGHEVISRLGPSPLAVPPGCSEMPPKFFDTQQAAPRALDTLFPSAPVACIIQPPVPTPRRRPGTHPFQSVARPGIRLCFRTHTLRSLRFSGPPTKARRVAAHATSSQSLPADVSVPRVRSGKLEKLQWRG